MRNIALKIGCCNGWQVCILVVVVVVVVIHPEPRSPKMFSHFSADNVTADNAAQFAIAELTNAIARIDSETAKNHEFIADQHKYLATSGGMFDNMTHEWITNTEECLAADARRRMVLQVMLDGLSA